MSPDPSDTTEAVLRWSDLVALIGAAAWLPHILRFFRRPKVSVIVGNPLELGFTGLGPIINPTLAFRTEHRDALITGIRCEVRHQQGQTLELTSAQLQETSGITHSSSGDSAFIHQKTQGAIAIVLTPAAISEKKVATNQRGHVKQLDALMVAYKDAIVRVHAGNPEGWYDRVCATAEHAAARNFMRDAFPWQVGSYTVRVEAKVAELRKASIAQFSFSLATQDVDLLRRNFTNIDLELYRVWCESSGVEQPRIPWLWLYKNI